MNEEEKRLLDVSWKKWGPYVSDRQWGTVREDYSENEESWDYITHDMAQYRAFRWGEEGIAGFSDDQQLLNFAFSFWNYKDPILKERLFGLTGKESNHGEDVKELYYYLDALPSHAYQKMLYKYVQNEFPYEQIRNVSKIIGKNEPEYELIDTGLFENNEYFDIQVEYAKAEQEDILVQINIKNQSNNTAQLMVLPTVWFRNTWAWDAGSYKPIMNGISNNHIEINHKDLGEYQLYCDLADDILFCDNETNLTELYAVANTSAYCKDGINSFLVLNNEKAINPNKIGTKAAAKYELKFEAQESKTIRVRLINKFSDKPFEDFDSILLKRKKETDIFYNNIQKDVSTAEQRMIQRQAYAGMLWSKQFFNYDVHRWLKGDPTQPTPPNSRLTGRNSGWQHFDAKDIFSMPDKWEYSWFAAWDLAFHTIPFARLDLAFAKNQIKMLLKSNYMHPSGQIPAYEWNFGDVNPPVQAFATWEIYKIEKEKTKLGDFDFLEEMFQKLLINFTWWVNRKDEGNNNIFEGGFLGLDNISIFDRSALLPMGGRIEQSDGTSWMAMFALNMLRISCELALKKPYYQGMASKFFEHFMYIAGAMEAIGGKNVNLWNDDDQFYYDMLRLPNGDGYSLKVRSIVGLIPLFSVEVLEPELLNQLPEFGQHVDDFLNKRPDLAALVSRWNEPGKGEVKLLSLVRGHRMKMTLKRMLNENEFLSDFGIRALSKFHLENPFTISYNNINYSINYAPAESDSGMFGGNSNWRGPIWMPINYLIIKSLQKFHLYYGDDFKVECPTDSGNLLNINEISEMLKSRLVAIFENDKDNKRPVFAEYKKFQEDPNFKDLILFHEYFHGDTGKGLGASHQTGWTGLISELLKS